MKQKGMKEKVLSGVIWRFGERICAQGVSFIVSIILARLLSPNDYGIIAILMIFIDIANVFVVSGFGIALVQKKDVDNLDYSSVFYFNILFSTAVYLLLFLAAPAIADFYQKPILIHTLRIMAIKIPLAGINSVQQAYVQKNMIFKKFFFSTIIGTFLSAIVGIAMAYSGYGVYALIAQYLVNAFCGTFVLWITVKWRPDFAFSYKRLKPLVQYGWKILAASLLGTFYTNLRSFVIGKKYSTSDLAYYNQGQKIPQMIVTNVNVTVDSVLLPAMSNIQDRQEKLKSMVRKSIRTSSMIMWPFMLGILGVSERLVVILLTEKWLPCLPFLWIACLQFALEPIHTTNLQAIKAMGRSDLILKLEIIKKTYGILAILVSMKYGVLAIAIGGITQTMVATICNTFPNRKLLLYSYKEQLRDLMPAVISSCIMLISVYFVGKLDGNMLFIMILQILTGVIVYVLISFYLQREEVLELLGSVKKLLPKKA